MDIDGPRRQDEVVDGVMAALYLQLDGHVSDSDTPYDVEAGLGQLTERMRSGREPARLPAVRTGDLELAAAASIPGRTREFAAALSLHEEAVKDESRQLVRGSDRRDYIFFGGIILIAMMTLGFLAFGHQPAAVAAAMTAVSGLTAAAGVLIHRSTGAVGRYARSRAEPPEVAEVSPGRQSRSKQGKLDVTSLAVKTPLFSVEFQRSQRPSSRSAGPTRRIVAIFLGVLMAACAVVFVVSAVKIVTSRPASANELGLIAAGAASILLAIIRWWWRMADVAKKKKTRMRKPKS